MRRLSLLAALAVLAAAPAAARQQAPDTGPISAQRISDITRELASDPYAGRAPGGPGEAKTIDYLVAQFRALGLEPAGDNGAFTQEVQLYRFQTQAGGTYALKAPGLSKALQTQTDLRIETQRPVERVQIQDAPLVFVGYGVTAPERGWDDFKGVDLKGKIALFLINDPDFEAKDGEAVAGKFGGRAATYYARWTYKYEEAVRRGALGALIVHETAGAAYPWSVVAASGGESYDVVRKDPASARLLLQGWIQRPLTVELFKAAGLDFEAEKARARTAAFRPVPLKGATFSADYRNAFTQLMSRNVVGAIRGSRYPDETIMYASHWDAYGIGAPDAAGATIRPGALDSATGVAAVIETARAFKAGPRPERTILFAQWTGEERGLLGSEFYAQGSPYPAGKMVASIAYDTLHPLGPTRDVVLIGSGQNQLEDLLKAAAAKRGRTVTPDPRPERALNYRADHFSFGRRGVPTLLLMALAGGPDVVDGGRAKGDKWVEDFTARCYHQTCDRWEPWHDYSGAAADVNLAFEIGRDLANSRAWPDWNEGSELKPIRAQTGSQRK
ncbi:M28 family metallopeptidase [Phenylobacterium sp.]|uniref:M28 family metallopeptidase n=1 Tax=Phenylobacterium sp. TaxID=1871053 RepID=UPI002812158D|nr:M28 family metallopeptidase [Phenylobacterium sp.]